MKIDKEGLYESTDKMVSHPSHYQSESGLEVINVIEAFTSGLSGIEATDTGNIIKYACRWKDKNGIQDLEKILWYTQHLITHLKQKEEAKKELNKKFGAENITQKDEDTCLVNKSIPNDDLVNFIKRLDNNHISLDDVKMIMVDADNVLFKIPTDLRLL